MVDSILTESKKTHEAQKKRPMAERKPLFSEIPYQVDGSGRKCVLQTVENIA